MYFNKLRKVINLAIKNLNNMGTLFVNFALLKILTRA